jgi:hypothetical protein
MPAHLASPHPAPDEFKATAPEDAADCPSELLPASLVGMILLTQLDRMSQPFDYKESVAACDKPLLLSEPLALDVSSATMDALYVAGLWGLWVGVDV